MERVIVSGGTGVTGNALVRFLLGQGIEVTAIVRVNSLRRNWLPIQNDKLRVVECDLGEYAHLADILGDVAYDAFFHLAWEGSRGADKANKRNAMKMQATNILYDIDAVELCCALGCKTFLATGSQAEYGVRDVILNEDIFCKPENGYGAAKYCACIMTRQLCREYQIKHIWARLLSVYGPYDGTHSLIDMTVQSILRGEYLDYTEGRQRWDYLYSMDAARALYLLALKGKDKEEYIVSSGNARPLRDYIQEIYEEVGVKEEPRFGAVAYSQNQIMRLEGDISKLRRDTGFEPEFSFREGIRRVIEWHQKYKGELL